MIGSLSVLILQSHSVRRMLAVERLRAMGCTKVYVALDSVSALVFLRKHGAVDVVICDTSMENMDGLDFLRQVDELHLAYGVIFLGLTELLGSAKKVLALSGLQILGGLGKSVSFQHLVILLKLYIRNRDQFYMSSSTIMSAPSLEMIQEGLCKNMFKAFYQPKFNLSDLTPCGAEVLVRWDHPRLGVLDPSFFLPLMTRYDLLGELFSQVFEQGVSFQARLLLKGYKLQLSYNLDIRQLCSMDFVQNIKEVLHRHSLPATLVIFELLETSEGREPRASMESMIRLREMGCGLAIDDFGIGYSSLQRLCDFPFNQIKLDMHFISNLELPSYRAAICSALVMAKALDMTMVVEGVESDVQRRILVQLGCTFGQGFWYAKPMEHISMSQWLNEVDTECVNHF